MLTAVAQRKDDISCEVIDCAYTSCDDAAREALFSYVSIHGKDPDCIEVGKLAYRKLGDTIIVEASFIVRGGRAELVSREDLLTYMGWPKIVIGQIGNPIYLSVELFD